MQSITELFILHCVNNLIISCKYNKLIFESPRSKFKAKQNIQSGSKCGKSFQVQIILAWFIDSFTIITLYHRKFLIPKIVTPCIVVLKSWIKIIVRQGKSIYFPSYRGTKITILTFQQIKE